MRCDTMRCDAMRCGAMRCDAIPCKMQTGPPGELFALPGFASDPRRTYVARENEGAPFPLPACLTIAVLGPSGYSRQPTIGMHVPGHLGGSGHPGSPGPLAHPGHLGAQVKTQRPGLPGPRHARATQTKGGLWPVPRPRHARATSAQCPVPPSGPCRNGAAAATVRQRSPCGAAAAPAGARRRTARGWGLEDSRGDAALKGPLDLGAASHPRLQAAGWRKRDCVGMPISFPTFPHRQEVLAHCPESVFFVNGLALPGDSEGRRLRSCAGLAPPPSARCGRRPPPPPP
eukprot:gene21817-biopygen19203